MRALQAMARAHGIEPRILGAVDAVNEHQKTVMFAKLSRHFEQQLAGRTIAVWGLAFKPRTDDFREAPALKLIDDLLKHGARVQVHDPKAMEHVQRIHGDNLFYADSKYDALNGAEALAIMTEWKQFVHPDVEEMQRRMKTPTVFDGRNLYEPSQMAAGGFLYHSIGRRTASPT